MTDIDLKISHVRSTMKEDIQSSMSCPSSKEGMFKLKSGGWGSVIQMKRMKNMGWGEG